MSWHRLPAAQLWTISPARFPLLDHEPTWELRMAPHQKLYYPRVFISLFIKLSQLWTWGEYLQLRGIAPNQQIISKALWNILFKSAADCLLWDMSAKYKTVVHAAGLSFFSKLELVIFVIVVDWAHFQNAFFCFGVVLYPLIFVCGILFLNSNVPKVLL